MVVKHVKLSLANIISKSNTESYIVVKHAISSCFMSPSVLWKSWKAKFTIVFFAVCYVAFPNVTVSLLIRQLSVQILETIGYWKGLAICEGLRPSNSPKYKKQTTS